MTSPDLIALLVVAAVLVVSALPFVVVAWCQLRELQRGREARESLLLRSVQFLPPLRVSSAGAALALASASASASFAESESFSVVSVSASPLLESRPVAGGLSVGNACGQPVVGGDAVVSASAVFAVNGLSIRIVHTVPKAQPTGVRRLSFEVFCSECISSDEAHCVCVEGFDPVVRVCA